MEYSNFSFSRHTFAGIIAIVLWSSTIAFSRTLTEQLGTLTTAFYIYSLAGIIGCVSSEIVLPGSISRMFQLNRKYLFGCGSLFILYIAFLYLAIGSSVNRSQVLAVGLINYLWPGLSLLFSIPILKKRARPWLISGLVIAIAGVWIVMIAGNPSLSGDLFQVIFSANNLMPFLLAFMAAISWGLYTNFSHLWAGNDETGAVPLFLLASGLVMGGCTVFFHEVSYWTFSSIVELIYMAIFPAMTAYFLWDLAVRKGNIILIASLSYFTPLLSTLFSIFILKISPDINLWAGTIMVVIGATICKFSIAE